MSTYEIEMENSKVVLDSTECSMFLNDDERPIEGIEIENIVELLSSADSVYFSKEYYDQPCEACHKNKKDGSKYYGFYEFHFYLFSKEGKYVMSSLSEEYKDTTLPKMLKQGRVDASYIVSINVCEHCGDYTVEIEYGLF